MSKIKTVGIVSLSSGILGESFMKHELDLGLRRMEELGLRVKFMPNALRGADFLQKHPEARAADFIEAFRDPDIDLIMTAIGGDDTYRLLPYLFDTGDFAAAVRANPKPFLGFSDTTTNHLMLHKLGLPSYYGQAFITELCELDTEMLPYSRRCFESFVKTGRVADITPSPLWYESRASFGPEELGVPEVSHPNGGFALLQGAPRFRGKILGGCIDTIFDYFDPGRYADSPALCEKYGLFPAEEDWRGRILLLESSEEKPAPEKYRAALLHLKERGVFGAVSGVLIGKPQDEVYDAEYRTLLQEVIDDPALPVVCNIPIGHAMPRCILPFGIEAEVDTERQTITFS